jgi:hypothetical protein
VRDLHRSILWLTLTLCSTFACGGDDESGAGNYEASCDMACSRAYQCDSSLDQESCAADCRNDAAAIGPKLNAGFLAGIDACIEELNCAELAVAAVFQTCQREAAARLSPSAAAEALCQAVADSIEECTGIGVGTAGCLGNVKIFRDSALAAARRCESRPCDQRTACLQTELGIDPTEQ